MASLVEKLQLLWQGIQMIDMTQKDGNHSFLCKGVLLWTMHDWPSLGSCFGLKVFGYEAYHIYNSNMKGQYREELGKIVYHEHR